MGNGRNETARVTRSSINGKNGRATYLTSLCVWPGLYSHFTECDVKLADDLTFAPIDESFWGWTNNATGASILLHEYGHVLGLDDMHNNSSNFNIMRGNAPQPWAGGNTTEPFPDDAAGIGYLYGGRWPGAIWGTNLFASAQFIDPLGSGLITTDEMKIFPVCRGSQFKVRITIGNNGAYDVTSGLRLYMNDTGNPADPGRTVWSGTATMPHWTTLTQQLTFTIPSNLTPGLYWFFWAIDSNSTVAEWNESDDTVHCAMSVQVVAC
ncbi:MAG: hypothetical protein JW940_24945 [Polyangiaceae bacterium]|nr:hypothetical protein [Polyangiaceae bacterium]